MALLQPRYITHYLPLFDNATDDKGRRLDRREQVEEGAVIFRRDGIVILGKEGFGFTRPINQVKFAGGCVANRLTDNQVLEIKNPNGEAYYYRYLQRDANWYRLVLVERSPHDLLVLVHALREDISDYGVILGIIHGGFRASWGLLMFLLWRAVGLAIVLAILHYTRLGIERCYPQQSGTEIKLMVELAWLLEVTGIGVLYLADWASTKGGRFYRQILPAMFLLSLATSTYLLFHNPGTLLHTLYQFRDLDTSQLSNSPTVTLGQ